MADSETFSFETHNGVPAINVKQGGSYDSLPAEIRELIEALGDNVLVGMIYTDVQQDFWTLATLAASRFGYGQAFSAGRSDGWLTVENAPILTIAEAEEHELPIDSIVPAQVRWSEFVKEIEAEIEHLRTVVYPERLQDALDETRATERREAVTKGLDDQALRSTVLGVFRTSSSVPRVELERLLNTYGGPIVERSGPTRVVKEGTDEMPEWGVYFDDPPCKVVVHSPTEDQAKIDAIDVLKGSGHR